MAVLVLLSSVPLFMVANKNFLPNDDQSEFEVGLRAPEGTSLDATESSPTASRRGSGAAGGRLHARDGRRRSGADAELGHGLRPAEAGRQRDAISSRS